MILLPCLAFAQHQVIKDQYIIKFKALSSLGFNTSNAISNLGLNKKEQIGSNYLVEKSQLTNLSLKASTKNSSKIVSYNSKNDRCFELLKSDLVAECSPNYILKISALPNDRKFSKLWGLEQSSNIDLNANAAWDVTTGSSDVVVAVIDTGVDYNHPDLQGNIWINTGEIAGNNLDDDDNGYVDDRYGYNAISGATSKNPFDDNGHGTHVAGTIGARGNNSIGVVGVNWNVKVLAVKFLNAAGSGSLADAIKAINYVKALKQSGVNIIVANNSWGGGGFNQALLNAIENLNNVGVLFAAAAGNESTDNDSSPHYPSDYEVDNLISVAAIDRNGNLASFSNYGAESVDIAAPGVDILSTIPNARYAEYSGTSMATPHVSGLLALLAASDPSLTPAQLKNRLFTSARVMSSLDGLVKTGRMINLNNAVRDINTPLPEPEPAPQPFAYETQELEFEPDLQVRETSIVQQSDELSYYRINLNTPVLFFGKLVTDLYVSPNGVVYTKRSPTGMDYQNSSSATKDSIAVLHSDLIANANPYGVRVRQTGAGIVIIDWQVQAYLKQGQGEAKLQLQIEPNGIIKLYYEFSTQAIRNFLAANSTVAIKGSVNYHSSVFQYNNSLVQDRMGIKFIPEDTHQTTIGLEAAGQAKSGAYQVGKAFRNRNIRLEIDSNDSEVDLQVWLRINGNYTCAQSILSSKITQPTQFIGKIARDKLYLLKTIALTAYSTGSLSSLSNSQVLKVRTTSSERLKVKRGLSRAAKESYFGKICKAIADSF